MLLDCGIEPEQFDERRLFQFLENDSKNVNNGKIFSEGIFCPWMAWKSDFIEIGGHDPLFAPQSKEDSDIFNRFQLNGVKFIQTWEGFVYHMTCRGSRFNPTLTDVGKNSTEWDEQNMRSARNFIRKWGHYVRHDRMMKPIIPHYYNIGLRVKNCSADFLQHMEPWCRNIYVDMMDTIREAYIQLEQPSTLYNLSDRVREYDDIYQYQTDSIEMYRNDILIEVDCLRLTQDDVNCIQVMPNIIVDSGIEGEDMRVENLTLHIKKILPLETKLIHCERSETAKYMETSYE